MRVLHVTPYFAPAFAFGGPPRNILGLCRSLPGAGVDVQVFTTRASGGGQRLDVPEGDRYDGVVVRYFPCGFPRGRFGARGLAAALSRDAGLFDLVHVHGLWHAPGWLAARAARRAGRRYVISPRGMLDAGALAHRAGRKRLAFHLMERRHLARAALLHAGSEREARAISDRRLGVPIATVPNGVDVRAADWPARGRLRHELGIGADAPLIVFVGRVHPIKRLDLLAGAFARLRASEPRARLAIAGPDDNGYRRRVEPLFGAAASAVRWLGEVGDADKWALLADADALVLCSDSESFGSSALEAMAAEVPVVVTTTCPWEEIEREGCGLVVSQDASAIARGLLYITGDRERARAMGARGRALAQSKYSWDAVARAMADHYRAVLSRAAAPAVVERQLRGRNRLWGEARRGRSPLR